MITVEESTREAEAAWLRGWIEGPKRMRWTGPPLQSGDSAPNLRLETADGAGFELRDAWRDGPAVLVFLRHFGCSCAWERAQRLKAEYAGLTAAGATVIAIGQADAVRSRHFAEKAELPCLLLSDAGRRAYEAYDLLEARPSQVVYGMPDAFLRRDPETGENFLKSRQGSGRSPIDSPWQLPGEFVVDSNGMIKLAHHSQYCADYADPDVLVAAIKEAVLGL